MEISKLGETGLIKKIIKKTRLYSKDIVKGIGDDAAVIRYDKKHFLLLTTDTLVEDDHFNLSWFKPERIGIKAVESNISDIAAMGGFPKHMLVSLTVPSKINVNFFDKLFDGIHKAAKKHKISIIGGNLAGGKKVSITISLVGLVEKKNLCLRSNAKVDDLILVTGNIGNSRAGLELLRNKKKGKSIDYYLNPKSRLDLSRRLAKLGINAMEDVSDGLASEVLNICNESKKGAVISKEKIPVSKTAIKDAKRVGKDAHDYALHGGEDYELVFTISKNKLKSLNKIKSRIKLTVVGKILPKKDGIYLLDKGKKRKLKQGYEHFKDN
ncbi:MAG: thiamine-phosphate kinase [Candidatus Woesearchaeota archaeon]|jgi:thiamine-monophosphate kinase|nr:thiamine-phosphate kinase [Candidatus Woesearchaeota archaeon]MDP7623231.1 thiamine-phosphate kinase [Candidatus Woesearchaeota archaeon]HJN56993.1 thiamine-phosphate kinase [Candidatus Woesearchaeota archaeon]|tara:strand:- start:9013 stop:9987 length:975 start_codon:yes stop_codon:yes gene_type:complete